MNYIENLLKNKVMKNYFDTPEYKASEVYRKSQMVQDTLFDYDGNVYISAINDCFVAGAKWQKERTCKWLFEHGMTQHVIERYRKDMEE